MLANIEAMPEALRDVFAQTVLGYTAPEIAAELEMDPRAVRMRLHRARKWLEDRLELRNKKRR